MKRILLIEDDYDLARSILLGIDLLEIRGLEKEVHYEGVKALARVQSSPPPDLLILDMHLPNVAGQDIYEAIRNTLPECRVIIITADVRLVREINTRQGDWQTLPPPDQVFAKPFSLIEFLESAKNLIAV
jgi:CheY-like chemotaxis protein